MTESVFLLDDSNNPHRMWNLYRCSKTFLILLLLDVIILQIYIYNYQQSCQWSNLQQALKPVVSQEFEMQEEFRSVIARLESSGLLSADMVKRLTKNTQERPVIFAITPTFARPVQKAELTRLSQTFLLVPNFHWIIVEDAPQRTPLVTNLLRDSGLVYTHLAAPTQKEYKLGRNDPNWKKPRGVDQRNAALKWLRDNYNETYKGVVFFADDDNTYSVKLFNEMAKIKTVGVWPVGLVGGLMVERPICDNATNRVLRFTAVWKPKRPFPLDMAGFAIHLRLIIEKKDAWFSYTVQSGYQESEILRQLITRDQLEPLADCCTKVYVWHTRTEKPVLNSEQLLIKKGQRSNEGIEV